MNVPPPQVIRKTRPRQTVTTLVALGFVCVLLMALIIAVASTQARSTTANHAAAPEFSLRALDGSTVTLSDYRGLILLVNFWASWCPPCRTEMPDLNAFHNQYRDHGFAVVAINMGEDARTVGDYMAEHNFRFPVLLDPSGSVSGRYGADALPTSFIIGRNGELIKAYPAGTITRTQMERDILPLLRG